MQSLPPKEFPAASLRIGLPPPGSADTPPPTWGWVPIRSLGPRHRERISGHLLRLEPSDRWLRFGHVATAAQISKYVDLLDFEHDEVFGIFSRRLELIAMAHLAHASAQPSPKATTSEFGVSVLPHARGRGFGRRLFEHAMLHARNRGIQMLLIHALSENTAMLRIARTAGATVERQGSQSEARLKLPPDSFSSHVGEMVEAKAAEWDYRLKLRSRQASCLLEAVGDVKPTDRTGKARHPAEE